MKTSLKNIVQSLPSELYRQLEEAVEATMVAPSMNRVQRRQLARQWAHVKRKDRRA